MKQLMKRVEVNDPVALSHVGNEKCDEGDHNSAFQYYTKAAASGYAWAHYQLSILYREGQGVVKDEKKFLHHSEQAAIGGHPLARHNLGCMEGQHGRVDRAVKHFIIASKLGFEKSIEAIKILYKAGHVSKEDFDTALRGYQTAINATKSSQRKEAYDYFAH